MNRPVLTYRAPAEFFDREAASWARLAHRAKEPEATIYREQAKQAREEAEKRRKE
jgi:hypothetical protein